MPGIPVGTSLLRRFMPRVELAAHWRFTKASREAGGALCQARLPAFGLVPSDNLPFPYTALLQMHNWGFITQAARDPVHSNTLGPTSCRRDV